jgi:hypothetical protein
MQSWEDFIAFCESGVNVRHKAGGGEFVDVLSPVEVAEVFDVLRCRFAGGDTAALWEGIRALCRYNVPPPYWLAEALQEVDRVLHTEVVSAHALLGLDAQLPLQKTRGRAARRNLQLARKLWAEVLRQRRQAPALSKAEAVKRARLVLDFPYQQRQATTMFDKVDAQQDAAAAPYRRVKRVQR